MNYFLKESFMNVYNLSCGITSKQGQRNYSSLASMD
jgi:hypothetical protein